MAKQPHDSTISVTVASALPSGAYACTEDALVLVQALGAARESGTGSVAGSAPAAGRALPVLQARGEESPHSRRETHVINLGYLEPI